MKLVIIEGSSINPIVDFLKKWHQKWLVVHWPSHENPQISHFAEKTLQEYQTLKNEGRHDIIIWNRSYMEELSHHIGQPTYDSFIGLEEKYLKYDLGVYFIWVVDVNIEALPIEPLRHSKLPNKKVIFRNPVGKSLSDKEIAEQIDKFLHHDGN
jgi:hypothetical protein